MKEPLDSKESTAEEGFEPTLSGSQIPAPLPLGYSANEDFSAI